MTNSIWIPTPFHMDSTGFHMEWAHIHIGFHGIPLKVHVENTMIFIVKNSVKLED
jgi:hypothetical protein